MIEQQEDVSSRVKSVLFHRLDSASFKESLDFLACRIDPSKAANINKTVQVSLTDNGGQIAQLHVRLLHCLKILIFNCLLARKYIFATHIDANA